MRKHVFLCVNDSEDHQKPFLIFVILLLCRSSPCMTLLDATWILTRATSPSQKMVPSDFLILLAENQTTKLVMFLPFFFLSVCQVMTWVWLLRSLNTWRISPSLPPVSWRYDFSIKVEGKSTDATFMAHNYPSPYLRNRMQSWSSTLEEKTLNMHQRVGSSLWTRHQRSTQSNLPWPVRCWCFAFFHNKSISKTRNVFGIWYTSDCTDTDYMSSKAVTALCFCRQRQSESGENFIQRAQSAHHRAV